MAGKIIGDWLYFCPEEITIRGLYEIFAAQDDVEIWEDAKKLIFEKVKNCDGCRYCVQTDKSGMRPLAAIAVEGVGKCPYFPSFSLRWNEVSEELPKQIMSLLEAYTIFGDKQLPRSVIKARL